MRVCLGALGLLGWRRKRKNAAAVAAAGDLANDGAAVQSVSTASMSLGGELYVYRLHFTVTARCHVVADALARLQIAETGRLDSRRSLGCRRRG
jgi:hypothetical protein